MNLNHKFRFFINLLFLNNFKFNFKYFKYFNFNYLTKILNFFFYFKFYSSYFIIVKYYFKNLKSTHLNKIVNFQNFPKEILFESNHLSNISFLIIY